MTRAFIPLVALLAVRGLFYGGVWLLERQLPSPKPSPLYEALQALHLEIPTGEPLAIERLREKIAPLNVFYIRCPSICPAMNAQLHRQVLPTDSSVIALSISTDPKHDTRAILAAFSRGYGLGYPWYSVRPCSETSLFVLAKNYLFQIVARISESDFTHTNATYPWDSQGQLQGAYIARRPKSMKQPTNYIQKLQSV